MRKTYSILATVVAALIVVQAAAMVWAVAGLGLWVEDGGVLDKATMESSDTPFPEIAGFIVHGMNGMMLIPLMALALLVVSFFAKVPRGTAVAGAVLGLVVLQVALGILGHSVPALGALHGVNALLLFATVLYARTLPNRATRAQGAPAGSIPQARSTRVEGSPSVQSPERI